MYTIINSYIRMIDKDFNYSHAFAHDVKYHDLFIQWL